MRSTTRRERLDGRVVRFYHYTPENLYPQQVARFESAPLLPWHYVRECIRANNITNVWRFDSKGRINLAFIVDSLVDQTIRWTTMAVTPEEFETVFGRPDWRFGF